MSDSKYITFKREDFFRMLDEISHRVPVGGIVERYRLRDAVVIRRQDKFASPCLATYASMISLVATNIDDEDTGKELMAIADYFEDQARLAAEEGWKLPDR